MIGYLFVAPDITFTDLVGKIECILKCKFIHTDEYDEFPAYKCDKDGISYSVLGIPRKEDCLRDIATYRYQVIIDMNEDFWNDSLIISATDTLRILLTENGVHGVSVD